LSRWLAWRKSGANDRFLVNPTLRWHGQKLRLRVGPGGSIVVTQTAAMGASRPLRRIPAIVSFLNPPRAHSLVRREPFFMPQSCHPLSSI
jgi:hypothetical protein